MKRQRVKNTSSSVYVDPINPPDDEIPFNKLETPDIWMEAQILPGDTLQAIALRFNCTISELKKLNKIDKDKEIFARRKIRVPITPHSVLLEALPKVHSSGNSSPKNTPSVTISGTTLLLEKRAKLDEKLIVAAVNTATYKSESGSQAIVETNSPIYFDSTMMQDKTGIRQPLLSGEYDGRLPQPRSLKLPTNDFSCNGSDCDISWICLLVCILGICFAIPMIYVFYVAEHLDKYHFLNGSRKPV